MAPQQAVVPLKVSLGQLPRCLVVCFMARITVAVWGRTGAGKSAVIKQTISDLGRKLYDFRLSVAEPTDIGGTPVPIFDLTGNADPFLQYLMANDLMPFKTKHNLEMSSALFLDEYDRTDNPNTRNASLQLIYDGCVNGHELVEDNVIVIAGNATYDDDTSTMSLAAAGRMIHLYVETESPSAMESFLEWADNPEDGLTDVTRGFAREHWLKLQGDATRTMTAELAYPSPRTLEFADRIMRICDSPEVPFPTKDIVEPLIQGCIGRAAATEFFSFRRLYLSAPTTAEILADPEHVRIPTKLDGGKEIPDPGILYSLTLSLCDQATKDDAVAKAVATYGLRWPEEPAAYLFRRLLDKYPQIATSDAFRKWNSKRLHTQPTSNTRLSDRLSDLAQIYGKQSKPLPENDQWVNRIQIPSESDPSRHYIVSQNRKTGTWACSCRAWTTRQTCKHIAKVPADWTKK